MRLQVSELHLCLEHDLRPGVIRSDECSDFLLCGCVLLLLEQQRRRRRRQRRQPAIRHLQLSLQRVPVIIQLLHLVRQCGDRLLVCCTLTVCVVEMRQE